MNQPAGQPEPRYVNCPCQHCSGNIEFDASQLEETEVRPVPCPHCGKETLLYARPQRVPPVIPPPAAPPTAEEIASQESWRERWGLVLRWYRRSAEQGDAACQWQLGLAFADGEGVAQDWSEAAQWLRKAAEQGNVKAQTLLGYCYWDGDGVTQDRAEAVRWFQKAAEHGNPTGQFAMGLAHFSGLGVLEDHAEAARLFRMAAEQAHATAQFKLSILLGKGDGVAKDLVEAHKWANLAAAQNEAKAEEQCAELASHMNAEQLGESLKRAQAFRADSRFKPPSADPEPSASDVFLGALRRFAETGDIEAQELLGHECDDKVEAAKWLRRAAEQGSAVAQDDLSWAYEKGEGVPKDPVLAAMWLRRAAEHGMAEAQYGFAVDCYCGHGVPENFVEAYRFANLAAAQGHEKARSLREDVAASMTPKQIAHAQRLCMEKAEQKSAREPIPSEVRREVWRRDGGKCVKCDSREKLEYDHIIPVAKGGSNTVRNIELLCESCNRSKSHSIQ